MMMKKMKLRSLKKNKSLKTFFHFRSLFKIANFQSVPKNTNTRSEEKLNKSYWREM